MSFAFPDNYSGSEEEEMGTNFTFSFTLEDIQKQKPKISEPKVQPSHLINRFMRNEIEDEVKKAKQEGEEEEEEEDTGFKFETSFALDLTPVQAEEVPQVELGNKDWDGAAFTDMMSEMAEENQERYDQTRRPFAYLQKEPTDVFLARRVDLSCAYYPNCHYSYAQKKVFGVGVNEATPGGIEQTLKGLTFLELYLVCHTLNWRESCCRNLDSVIQYADRSDPEGRIAWKQLLDLLGNSGTQCRREFGFNGLSLLTLFVVV
jgi:hypothetical protein